MKPEEVFGLVSGCILIPLIIYAGWVCDRAMDRVFDVWEKQAENEMKESENKS